LVLGWNVRLNPEATDENKTVTMRIIIRRYCTALFILGAPTNCLHMADRGNREVYVKIYNARSAGDATPTDSDRPHLRMGR
jgi:hypothetical protein